MASTTGGATLDIDWWKTAVIYQIYPRSFQDSDGNGVGDLVGIIARLDALVELGVDAIWLSPIFTSPMADFGYDVADHTAIDPIFGGMDDFDQLVDEVHRRGMKLILDFIPNHTSDEHPWFIESRSSRDSDRHNWYVWSPPGPDGCEPNNWRSEFGGPAWTWDGHREQYYYHAFLASQPDLNWREPAVAAAMLDVMTYWLERGVDGFRVDAIHHLVEREDLTDNPVNPDWQPGMAPVDRLLHTHTVDQPETHSVVRAMRGRVERYGQAKVLIGEAYLPLERLMTYYGPNLDEFQLPFNFLLMSVKWTAADVAALVERYEAALPSGAWPNWVLGNHDRSRLATRIGLAQARVAALLLLTLRGTPTIYQGEELGMIDVPIAADQVRDPFEINVPGLGLGRDPSRTPLPWSDEPNAGFSTGNPWLPLGSNWRISNVERQRADRGSIWNSYRNLLAVRRGSPALQMGEYSTYAVTTGVFAFERKLDKERYLVILNLSNNADTMRVPPGRLVYCTTDESFVVKTPRELEVPANVGMVFQLS